MTGLFVWISLIALSRTYFIALNLSEIRFGLPIYYTQYLVSSGFSVFADCRQHGKLTGLKTQEGSRFEWVVVGLLWVAIQWHIQLKGMPPRETTQGNVWSRYLVVLVLHGQVLLLVHLTNVDECLLHQALVITPLQTRRSFHWEDKLQVVYPTTTRWPRLPVH